VPAGPVKSSSNAVQRIGKSAFVYTFATLLQRGAAFILLPLYTRVLTQEDFGTLSVVIGINGLLSILYTFSLHGAVTRFYVEYRDSLEKRRAVLGTIISSVLILSITMALVTFWIGANYFKTIGGNISFFPYMALGIVATIFQPIYLVCLNLFRIKEQPLKYAVMTLGYFLVNVGLVIYFLLVENMGAEGPLWALLIVSALFAGVTLFHFRHEFKWGINIQYLKQALKYSLPIIPHNISGQFQAFFDRFLLSSLIGTAVTGQYQVGFLIGSLMAILTESVNKAYVPVALSALKNDTPDGLNQLREVGSAMAVVFALAGSFISLFADEIIQIVASASYQQSAYVIPYIAFSFVFGGGYYIFVNIFFYDLKAVRYLSIFTISSALINVGLNLILIPKYSMLGAGLSALISQMVLSIAVAFFGSKFEKIRWRYIQIFMSFFICFGVVICVRFFVTDWIFIYSMLFKAFVLVGLHFLLNMLHWNTPNHLFFMIKSLMPNNGRRIKSSP